MKKKFSIFTVLPVLFLICLSFQLQGASSSPSCITVSGKVTGPWHPELAVCNGKDFFPVKKDGSFSFSYIQKSGTPFVYLTLPDSCKALSPWKFPLKYGKNELSFQIAPRKVTAGNFNFIHGSDVQFDFLKEKSELEDLADSIASVMKKNHCDFITLPGDLSTHGDVLQLQALKAALDKRQISYFEVFGGHDALRSRPLPFSHFARVFGAPYSSWNWNSIHFIAPITESSFMTPEERARHLEWLKNDLKRLAPGIPVIILTHLPAGLPGEFTALLKSSGRKIHAFLGAHHHLDGIYTLKGSVNIYNTPLRNIEAGSLTRKLRIVTLSAAAGIKETRSCFLGYDRFISGFLCRNGKAVFQICDTGSQVKSAWIKTPNAPIPLPRRNGFFREHMLKKGGKIFIGAAFNDGSTVEKELSLSPDPKIKWCYVTDALYLHRPEVVCHKGRLYLNITSGNFPGKGGVTALDAATGKKLWHTALPGNIDAGAAIWKNQLFVLSASGVFYILDAENGQVLKKKNLAENLSANSFIRCTVAPVVTAGGKVFIQGTGITPALYDTASGEFTFLPRLRTAHAFHAAAVSGNLIALTSPAAILFDAEQKKILWKAAVSVGAGSQAPPVFDKNAVYFALQRVLVKADLASGKILWTQKTWARRQEMGGIVKTGNLILLSAGNRIGTFDAATGKRVNKFITLPCFPGRPGKFRRAANQAVPVLINGKVLLPTDMAGIQLFDPDAHKLTLVTDPGLSFQGRAGAEGKNIFPVSAQGAILAVQL
jgi:outer membrane protein assembly factor BamB